MNQVLREPEHDEPAKPQCKLRDSDQTDQKSRGRSRNTCGSGAGDEGSSPTELLLQANRPNVDVGEAGGVVREGESVGMGGSGVPLRGDGDAEGVCMSYICMCDCLCTRGICIGHV